LTLTPAAITVCTDVADCRIESPNVIFGDRDILGECAVPIDADYLHVLADMGLPRSAKQTGEIGDVSFGRNAFANANRTNRRTHRGDGAHEFVSDD
jgi:hypothetical protein